MIFIDLYHNSLSGVKTDNMRSLRIFGIQDNRIEKADVSQMPALWGIDVGMKYVAIFPCILLHGKRMIMGNRVCNCG